MQASLHTAYVYAEYKGFIKTYLITVKFLLATLIGSEIL